MKKKIFGLLLAGLSSVWFSGCISTVDGHKHAGVPFKKDTISGRYERTVPQLFEAAKAVILANGTLQADNRVNNSLVGKVDTRTVYIKIDEDEPTISRVTVQVRKASGGADIDLASELEKQIALRLAR
jgi:hypothetical protein